MAIIWKFGCPERPRATDAIVPRHLHLPGSPDTGKTVKYFTTVLHAVYVCVCVCTPVCILCMSVHKTK